MAGSLRDRFFTPKTARAMTSPLGILLAGAGAAVGIVLLGPSGAALGAVAWAARVAAAVGGPPGKARVGLEGLGEPWRSYVHGALESRRRFDRAVELAPGGPLSDRLSEIGGRIDAGVAESHRVARQAQTIAEARRSVDVAGAANKLAAARQSLGHPGARGRQQELAQQTVAALEAQLAAAQRMDAALVDADARLRLLDARLAEAVTRAVELSTQAHDVADLGELGADVESVVTEMEALRLALEETRPTPLAQPEA